MLSLWPYFFRSFESFRQKSGVKLNVFGESVELNESLMAKMRSKTVRFPQYTAYSEKKQNYAFSLNTLSEM